MEPTEDELEEVIETALQDNGYEYVASYMAFKITDAVRKLYAEKKAEHQKKLNIVHAWHCDVARGKVSECDCGGIDIDGT